MEAEVKQYRSPTPKLMRFFEKSRDRWKQKCLESKNRVKLLHTKVADLKVSRQRWKDQARSLQRENAQLQAELEALKNAPA